MNLIRYYLVTGGFVMVIGPLLSVMAGEGARTLAVSLVVSAALAWPLYECGERGLGLGKWREISKSVGAVKRIKVMLLATSPITLLACYAVGGVMFVAWLFVAGLFVLSKITIGDGEPLSERQENISNIGSLQITEIDPTE